MAAVTIYDYDAAYRGAAFVQQVQDNSDTVERYHTIEAAVARRLSGRWMAQAAGFAVKNHRWIEQDFQTPNDDLFPLDQTWNWGMNLSGMYRLPADVRLAAFLQAKRGVTGQRTNIFRSADPDGGTPLRQLSTVTLRLEPYGSQRGDTITSTNLRVSKDVRLGGSARVVRCGPVQRVQLGCAHCHYLAVGPAVRSHHRSALAAHCAVRRAVQLLSDQASHARQVEEPMKNWLTTTVVVLAATVASASADPLTCNLAEYKAAPGLAATVAENALVLTWDGTNDQELRLQFTVNGSTPTIRELALRRKGGQWAALVTNAMPDYRVATGLRRATDQQLNPLRELKVEITPEVIDDIKWEAFWDAPLNVPGGDDAHGGATPPIHGVANQPGLPRKPEEVRRAVASYQTTSCSVKTNGGRIEVAFPGVQLGVFAGRLEYTVYKGVNLIKQSVVAKTDEKSVAYKYEAGLKGLKIQPSTRVAWRSVANEWVDYKLGGAKNENVVPLKAANRLVVVEGLGGSIAAFPPPHRFFTARELEYNLGYNFYRKDGDATFAFGVRHAEGEEDPSFVGRGPEDVRQNFALHSARPGTWQQMPVFSTSARNRLCPPPKARLPSRATIATSRFPATR